MCAYGGSAIKDPSATLGMTVLGERIGSQGWCAAFLEDGILVSQPSPLGEGAPQGRIGCLRYESQCETVPSEQALGEGPRQRRRIECLEEAQVPRSRGGTRLAKVAYVGSCMKDDAG